MLDRLKRMFIMGFRQILDPYYHGFAAQISFYLMLSVVPLLLLIIQLLGIFGINMETALDAIEQYTGQRMSGIIGVLFKFNSIGFGNIIFLIITLWAGSRASFVISRIANYIMTEGENTGKNYFIERGRAVFTMLLTTMSFVAALIILCYGKIILIAALTVFNIDDISVVDSMWLWLRWPLGFVLYFFIIGSNYYIIPTVKRPFRTVIPGSAFASLGIMFVSWLYSFHTESLVNYDLLYGALSSVIAIMIWFLLLSWVIILGIMCNKVFYDTSRPFSKKDPPEHLAAYRQSRYDMDPKDVRVKMIKDIIIKGDDAVTSGELNEKRYYNDIKKS